MGKAGHGEDLLRHGVTNGVKELKRIGFGWRNAVTVCAPRNRGGEAGTARAGVDSDPQEIDQG